MATTVPPLADVQPTAPTIWLGSPSPIDVQFVPPSVDNQIPPVPFAAKRRLFDGSYFRLSRRPSLLTRPRPLTRE
jgi:hypothetical protein